MNVLPTVLGIAPLVPIVILCYLLGATLKAIKNETLDKFIPIISGLFGGIIAIIVLFTIPGYLSATNWLDAFATGAASGLVAVGINQIYKQFTKEDTYDGVFEGEVPNEKFDDPEDPKEDEDPKDETKEEE